ncbi:MAG: hypothetical protein ACYSTS_15520 [Planctomycetota bacterium]|jgi:hypothetical protein
MYKTNVYAGAYNYNDILYFLSNITINPHIDRITFSCDTNIDKPEDTLFSVLQDNSYRCKSDSRIKGVAYERIRIYQSRVTGISISIFYNRKSYCSFFPCIRVIIDNPDIDTIDWFDGVCNSFNISTTLSNVELTIDFSPYKCELHEFFWKHLILKYYSGGSCFVGSEFGSFYVGNKNKNSKSVILYPKKIDNKQVLRLEFRLKRTFLERIGVSLDCFENINSIDLSRFVSFKRLNREKLLNHLIWKHKLRLSTYDEDDKDLFIHQLGQIPSAYGGVVDEIAYMKKIPYINNCQRFFEDIPEVNEAFFARLKGARFI